MSTKTLALKDEISEAEQNLFLQVVSTRLSPEQAMRIRTPLQVYPGQDAVLAVHWHPEYIPLELIGQRIQRLYPDATSQLIIPTQHNTLMSLGQFSGVEIDCYSRRFNHKVQLLLHFSNHRLARAARFKSMLAHTFNYRATQLQAFMQAITRPDHAILKQAAQQTGADANLINLVAGLVKKVAWLLEVYQATIAPEMIKNRLLRNFLEGLRPVHGHLVINRAQSFLAAVKAAVKKQFSPTYFYRTSEVLEEARYLGAGIVVPHPEQFWPILLADYDVDGYEVWNPQSHQYTEFLIEVLHNKNRQRRYDQRELLLFMGDDTHMGEKALDPPSQNADKARREIGLQPAWDDIHIRKALIAANMNRQKVIQAYRERLN